MFSKEFFLSFQRGITRIRHLPRLNRLNWLWNFISPIYWITLRVLFPRGGLRHINGIGYISLCHECKNLGIPAPWEIEWLATITKELREGDVVVDVGAYIGMLSIIFAKKVGATGKVIAIEPIPEHYSLLKKNLRLNDLMKRVECLRYAVGDHSESLLFKKRMGSISCVIPSRNALAKNLMQVPSVSLDDMFKDKRVDMIKIDVEGYEIHVLRGAHQLLNSKNNSPRFMFIECHPYQWKSFDVNGKELLYILRNAGYTIRYLSLPDNMELDDYPYHCALLASKNT